MNESRRPQGAHDRTITGHQGDGRDSVPPVRPRADAGTDQETRPLSDMISGVVENVQNIVRYEVQLAKTELQQEAKTAGKGVAMLAAGALVGFYALGLFLLTAVWALATQVDRWLAALIVAVVVAVIAGALAMVGKKKLDEFSPKPDETIDSVKEDIEWVKRQTP
jgi:uncharacterized membrane protein YqjE